MTLCRSPNSLSDTAPLLTGSLNHRSLNLLHWYRDQFDALDVRVSTSPCGATIYDFGARHPGTLLGGRLLAEVCLAGLAEVQLTQLNLADQFLPAIQVATDHPLQACIAGQYAGWPVSGEKYFAMGSGPARLLRGREPMLEHLQLREESDVAVLVLEAGKLPPDALLASLAAECQVSPENLHVAIARTASLAGLIQIVARSVETTLHKLFELGFDLKAVRSAVGWAPLPPVPANDLLGIGWSNDAILFGGRSHLYVETDDAQLEALRGRLTSDSSPDFGAPFIEIFERYERDFYRIDKLLFSPAQTTLCNLRTGRVFTAGQLHVERLLRSFGLKSDSAPA
jgi:methenyltetrahydromethanopterin cyclohydrolase